MKPFTLLQLQEYAQERGGRLLTESYKDCKQKLLWRCRNGHQWQASWDGIKNNGSWCPACVGRARHHIEKLQQYAIGKGGLLISTVYYNNNSKLIWQCHKGHQWMAKWQNIQSGKWCPKCAGKQRSTDIEMNELAQKRGGRLVSGNYKTSRTKLLWECEKGHQWLACWHDIQQGNWCPACSVFKNESECRRLLESYLGIPLPKTQFFSNHKRYEWDGYNAESKIAFEYNGEQHYKQNRFFHRKRDSFVNQQKRDKEKEHYAKENGITLIVIPYTDLPNLKERLVHSEDRSKSPSCIPSEWSPEP
jgi:hypothetical protein